MINALSAATVLLAVAAVPNCSPSTSGGGSTPTGGPDHVVVDGVRQDPEIQFGEVGVSRDDFDVVDVDTNVVNRLVVTVEYSGGCEVHDFEARVVNGVFEEPGPNGGTMLEFDLELYHDANGDACEALQRRTLAWDLEPLIDELQYGYPSLSGFDVTSHNEPIRMEAP